MFIKEKKDFLILILVLIIVLQMVLIVSLRPKKIPVKPPKLARVAIVIDDWGYNINTLAILEGLNLPVNLAILPNLAYSKQTAKIAKDNHWEIILHLPLEPEESRHVRLEKDTVLVDMPQSEILDILNKARLSVPGARGISNHMGSKATRDSRTMSVIFGKMKKDNLYFLDSFVSVNSVCYRLARKEGLHYLRRDVFLDNKEDPDYIKGQIEELIDMAKENGHALGIGHNHRVTLEVLREELPRFRERGVELVLASELLR